MERPSEEEEDERDYFLGPPGRGGVHWRRLALLVASMVCMYVHVCVYMYVCRRVGGCVGICMNIYFAWGRPGRSGSYVCVCLHLCVYVYVCII